MNKHFHKTQIYSSHNCGIYSVSYSFDEKWIVSGDEDGFLIFWKKIESSHYNHNHNHNSFEYYYKIKAHDCWIRCLSFSSDNKYLLSGSGDTSIVLWEIIRSNSATISSSSSSLSHIINRYKEFYGHSNYVRGLSWLNNNNNNIFFVSVSFDCIMKIWNVIEGEEINSINTKNINNCMSINNNKSHLAIGHSFPTNSISIWNVLNTSTTPLVTFSKLLPSIHKGTVSSIAYSKNDLLFASGSSDSTIVLWKHDDYQILKILEGHKNFILSLSFSPIHILNDIFLASSSNDKSINYWNCTTYECEHSIPMFASSISFSPISNILLTGCNDSAITITSIISKEQIIFEQSYFMLCLFKSKIKTPYVIIFTFEDFMKETEYI